MKNNDEAGWIKNIGEPIVVLTCLALVWLLAIAKIYVTQRQLVYVYDHLPEYELTIKCTDHQFKDKANMILSSKEYAIVNDEDELIVHIIPDNCKITETYQLGDPINANDSL